MCFCIYQLVLLILHVFDVWECDLIVIIYVKFSNNDKKAINWVTLNYCVIFEKVVIFLKKYD